MKHHCPRCGRYVSEQNQEFCDGFCDNCLLEDMPKEEGFDMWDDPAPVPPVKAGEG